MTKRILVAIALLAGGCGPSPSSCAAFGDCDSCTRAGGCAFCLETAECLDDGDTCPGDEAITPEQCEAEEVAAVDAGVTGP